MIDKIKGVIPLNWALMANPVNWVIVILMCALAGYGLAFIITSTNVAPKEDE